jgi:hypothetical protein
MRIEGPGQYFAQHGATEWNGGREAPRVSPAGAAQRESVAAPAGGHSQSGEVGPRPLYRPRFARVRPATNADEFFSQSEMAIDRDADGEEHLYLNWPAARLLRHVDQLAGGSPPAEMAGVAMESGWALHLAGALERSAPNISPAYRQRALRLAELLREMASRSNEVSVVNADPDVPEEEIRATEREEAFHRAQGRAMGGRTLSEREARRYFASNTPMSSGVSLDFPRASRDASRFALSACISFRSARKIAPTMSSGERFPLAGR